nr:hypothetical protein [Candidatus Njordarchaeota archaeon]
MRTSNFFVKSCKAATSHRILHVIGRRIFRSRQSAVERYYRRFRLGMEDVSAGAALIFLVSLIISFVPLFYLVGFLSLFISLLFSYGVSSWFRDAIPRKMEEEKLAISYQVPIILQEIVLASAGSGSIFDLITLLVKGKHPIVSKAFAKITKRVSNGDEPEKLIRKYANLQPCQTLRRYLLDAVSLGLNWTELKNVFSRSRGEAEYEYQKYTMQVESRVLLVIGLGTFWPIIFSISIFVNSLWHNVPVMLLIALLFLVLLALLQKLLMKPVINVEILGDPKRSYEMRGVLNHTAKEELQETIVILSLVGEFLCREKVSPESAVKSVSQVYGGWLSPLFTELARRISYNAETFNDAWQWFKNNLTNIQCRQIIGILPQMIEKTAEEAGERLIDVVSYVRENMALTEERENIFAAQRFKAKLLSLFSSAALGLVAALSPLFAIVSAQHMSFIGSGSLTSTHDVIITAIVLLSMTALNTLNAMKTVRAEKPMFYALVSASIFMTVFTLSIHLVSGLI